jgi:phage shock protein PspC (stress-responsive transcriptional regulator)
MLAGVAGGVAETLDADPSLVRIVWALLAVFTGGIAILVYIVMAIVVPEAPASSPGTHGAPGTPGATMSGAAAPGGAPAPSGGPGSYWATDREARRAARRARRSGSGDSSRAGLVGGLVLIVIGTIFLIREVVPWFDWNLWWPIGLILLGGLLLVLALLPGRSAD